MADQSATARLALDEARHGIAIQIQSAPWGVGKVRGAVDILIAAIGHRHGATIVHCDKKLEMICTVMEGFRQRWIAPAGSLD